MGTPRIDPTQFLAHDVVAHHSGRTPHKVALANADTGREYTWEELETRVARCAGILRSEHAIAAGDRVVVIADNDPKVLELQFACMRVGAIFVPLNWRLAYEELAYQCDDAAVSLVVHDDTWAVTASKLAGERGIAALNWGPDGEYETLLDGAAPVDGEQQDWDAATHILYTSGTTGRPKGALSSRRSLAWQAINLAACDSVASDAAHHLNPMPLFHAGGLNVVTNPILFFGGRVSTMAKFDPERIMQLLGDKAFGVTHFAAVPLMYQALASVPEFDRTDYSHVRHAICAGAVATPDLLRRWAAQGCPLEPQFGGTETGPTVLHLDARDLERTTAGLAGRPIHHTEVRLVDPLTELDVADGEVGELWVRGPSITPGYWNRDRDEFFTDGFFRTGDALRRDSDGYYVYSGRFKDMYKSGGENVYAAEVEAVLQNIPGVAEVAIIGIPDERWGEVGLAVIVAAAGGPRVDLATIEQACDGRLARYKFPKRLEIVDSLPRNVTGKVAKADLRATFAH